MQNVCHRQPVTPDANALTSTGSAPISRRAIDGLMENEANAVRADMFEEASRFQAAIPHVQEVLVSVERAIAAAAADKAD